MYLQYNYFCDVEYPNLDQLSTVRWQVNDVLWHRGNSELKPRIMHYSEITKDLNYMFVYNIEYTLPHLLFHQKLYCLHTP